MKKIMMIGALLLASAAVTHAQNFKPFKVGLGIGAAVPNRGEGGALFYVEPAYRPSSNTLVGLRIESGIMSKEISTANGVVNGNAKANNSYTINGQYYFNDNYVRPFVGGGLGLFRIAQVKYDDGDAETTSSGTSLFGFYPRVGLDIGHLNLAVDYNVIPNSDLTNGAEMRNSYLGMRAGMSIGGGVGAKKK